MSNANDPHAAHDTRRTAPHWVIGWAFIAGGLLLDFERGPRMPTPGY